MDQIEEEIMTEAKPKLKQFDIISGPVSSDHYYYSSKTSNKNTNATSNKNTNAKKIAQEWKILEKSLPESIFVRVYEDRIDLLRAVIVGSPGTPYANGLFFFDISFPSDYPSRPPQVHYHSHGLRLNPNLYDSGYVCLSLLNTWSGKKDERWVPSKSTILQVLVSIQGLVLNEEPYFNEPRFFRGEIFLSKDMRSKQPMVYNEEKFLLSCITMLYVASKPPKHFEEFVVDHFHERSEAILKACRDYIRNGYSSSNQFSSEKLKNSMKIFYPQLQIAFSKDKSSSASSSLGTGNSSSKIEIKQVVAKEGCGFGQFIESCLGFKKVKKNREDVNLA